MISDGVSPAVPLAKAKPSEPYLSFLLPSPCPKTGKIKPDSISGQWDELTLAITV